MKLRLKKRIKHVINKFCYKKILPENMCSIHDREVGDVYIVAYPKSGITWMQNIIAGLVYGCNPELTPDSIIQTLVPDLHWKKEYIRFLSPSFFKTHSRPNQEYKKVIYIVRDGRDVLNSFIHYYNALNNACIKLDDILYNEKKYIPFGNWSSHIMEWYNNPFNSDILFIRYEDLKNNLFVKLEEMVLFLNLDRDEEYLSKLVCLLSIDKQQEKERLFKMSHPDWPNDKLFHRKGIVGEGKALMNHEQLSFFNEKHADALNIFGYNS